LIGGAKTRRACSASPTLPSRPQQENRAECDDAAPSTGLPQGELTQWPSSLRGSIVRTPHLRPIAARDGGGAAVGLEELVGPLEDREHQPALRAPRRVAAAGGAPDKIALRDREARVRTGAVYQLAFEHIGLLDLDVLMVGEHRAGRKAHQRGHKSAVAIEQ